MNLFQAAIRKENLDRPPIWFMRQAGRYHSHYQKLRAAHSFVDLCKVPEVACQAAMGPIQDFNFDAAILFSDLLFPLEVMGMDLAYAPGPKLGGHLKNVADVERLEGGPALASRLQFQAEAMRLTRSQLSSEKGLLGFVGGPLTLFFYAVEGSHQGELQDAKAGLTDGRFELFCEKLLDLLAENMALQARAGADTVAILDTCAGEVDTSTYGASVVPKLHELIQRFHERVPGFPVTYYSKKTGPDHWNALDGLRISCLGVDWRHSMPEVLERFGDRWAIQGNFDPEALFLAPSEFEKALRAFFQPVADLPARVRRGWVCGLGHGVLPKTPEANVKRFIQMQREIFS